MERIEQMLNEINEEISKIEKYYSIISLYKINIHKYKSKYTNHLRVISGIVSVLNDIYLYLMKGVKGTKISSIYVKIALIKTQQITLNANVWYVLIYSNIRKWYT